MTREITKLRMNRIDLTDDGANLDPESGEGSFITLAKRATPGDKTMTTPTIEDLAKQVEDLTAKLTAATTANETVEKRAKDAEAKVEELSKSKDDEKDELASLPEPLRKRFEDLERRAADDRKAAEAARDSQLESEWLAKSATFQLPGLVAAKFAPIMKRASIALPKEDVAEIETILKGATEAIRQSGLMTEQGNDGAVAGSASEEIRKRATALAVEKDLPYESAYAKVLEASPELQAKIAKERAA